MIPTFLAEPLKASDVHTYTPKPPEAVSEFRYPSDPGIGVFVFRRDAGVFENSGTPIDINGIDGYVRSGSKGSEEYVAIEWRVDGLWQVFEMVGTSETDALDAARRFQESGTEGLLHRGWKEIQPPEQRSQTIVNLADGGALGFLDEPDIPLPDVVLAEENDFTVSAPDKAGYILFVAYQGRLIFSYSPPDPTSAIDPVVLADSLAVVTEKQWRAWIDTWAVGGSVYIDESQACREGVWETEVALRLAEQYINEDLKLSVRGAGLGEPSTIEGAKTLYESPCPSRFAATHSL